MPDILTCLYPFKRLSTHNNSFKTLDESKLEWLLSDFKTFDNLMSLEKHDNKHHEQNSNYSLTLVSRRWELTYNCHRDGGEFRKPGSDVVLHVPPGAVECEDHVPIHAAVCADVDRIRRVLQLPDHEVIVSPLAEYWAGQDFQFECPVTITLPHCLPDKFDPSLVRVYRVNHGDNGQVRVTRVKGQDFENTNQDGHFPWEDSGHFVVSSEGKVQVFTEHFCGYVCTYCDHSQNSPELVAMAYGSHKKTQTGRHNVSVHMYVWDKRIDIADFRNEYDIGLNEKKLGRTTVSLLEDLQDSKLSLKLEVIGDDAERWQHTKRVNGRLAFPVIQEQMLKFVLSCDNAKCKRNKSAPPMTMRWRLQTNGDVTSCDACAVVIDISHVHVGSSVDWETRPQSETCTSLDLEIPLEEPSAVGHCDGCVCSRWHESRLASTMQTDTAQARQEATREWRQAINPIPRPCSRDDTARKVFTTLTQAPEASRCHQAEIPPASDSQLLSCSANGHLHSASAASNVPATTEVDLSRSSNAVEKQITNNFTFNFASSASSTNGPILYLPVGENNTITTQREDRHPLNALPETLPMVELPPESMSLTHAAIEQSPCHPAGSVPQLQWYPQQSQPQSAETSSVADSGHAPAGSIPPLLPNHVSNAESERTVETQQLQTVERGLQNGVHDSLHNGMPNGNSSAVSELTQHTENGVHSPSLDSDPSELRFRSPQPVSDHDDIRRSIEV